MLTPTLGIRLYKYFLDSNKVESGTVTKIGDKRLTITMESRSTGKYASKDNFELEGWHTDERKAQETGMFELNQEVEKAQDALAKILLQRELYIRNQKQV